jgi:hypothetical protein
VNISPLSLETRVRNNLNYYVKITGRAIVRANIALPPQAKPGTIINACGNIYRDLAFLLEPSCAMTMMAGLINNLTRTITFRANPDINEAP